MSAQRPSEARKPGCDCDAPDTYFGPHREWCNVDGKGFDPTEQHRSNEAVSVPLGPPLRFSAPPGTFEEVDPRPDEARVASGPKVDCDNCHGSGAWHDIVFDEERECPCVHGVALKEQRTEPAVVPDESRLLERVVTAAEALRPLRAAGPESRSLLFAELWNALDDLAIYRRAQPCRESPPPESTAERLERLGFEKPPPWKMDPFVRPMRYEPDACPRCEASREAMAEMRALLSNGEGEEVKRG